MQQKKVGHIARACRRKPTQTGFKDKWLKDHHYLEDEIQDTAASQKQSKEHPYPLFNMDSNEHKAFMVDVNINQVPVSMEYDTGAALSLITKKMYKRIYQRNHIESLQDSDVQLRMYTGQLVPLLGATSVNVECGEKQDMLQVLVVKGEEPKIWGRDWITAFKAFKREGWV